MRLGGCCDHATVLSIYDKKTQRLTLTRSAMPRRRCRKANYRHFMPRIHEQPELVGHTFGRYVEHATERVACP